MGFTLGIEGETFFFGDLLYPGIFVHGVIYFGLHSGHHAVDRLVGKHSLAQQFLILVQIHAGRNVKVDGQLINFQNRLADVFLYPVEIGLLADVAFEQLLGVTYNAILGFPGFEFFFAAIGRSVRGGMAAVAIGKHIEKDRPLFVVDHLTFTTIGIDHCQGIVAVHSFGMHLFGVDTGSDTGCNVVTHGFALGLSAHTVLVVHDVEDKRQAAFHIVVPKSFKLIHGRKNQTFPNGTAGHGGVAQVGDHQAGFTVDFFIEGCSHGNIAATAYDGVVGINAEGGEKGVHTAAQAPIETGYAGKDFGQSAVDQKATGQLPGVAFEVHAGHLEGGSAKEFLHDFFKAVFVELTNSRHALGQDFTVAAVRTENKVVYAQGIGHTDGGGFLSHREVSGTGVIVGYVFVCSGGFDQMQHGFEFPDQGHVVVNVEQILFAEIALVQFLFGCFIVLVYGNGLECNFPGFTHFRGVDE